MRCIDAEAILDTGKQKKTHLDQKNMREKCGWLKPPQNAGKWGLKNPKNPKKNAENAENAEKCGKCGKKCGKCGKMRENADRMIPPP